jgi:hypothetical protein
MLYSESESRRFGLRVFRYEADTFDAPALKALVVENNPDLAICRVPAANITQMWKLAEVGLSFIVAGVLVHYTIDLGVHAPIPLRHPGLRFDECVTTDDIDDLAVTAREVFRGYTNHYNANPALDRERILEGQIEWATSYAGGQDTKAFLLRRNGAPLGFATHRYKADATEFVLGGVLPSSRHSGVYRDALRHSVNMANDLGHKLLLTSTQVHNVIVQRVYLSEGFILGEPQLTFHIVGWR